MMTSTGHRVLRPASRIFGPLALLPIALVLSFSPGLEAQSSGGAQGQQDAQSRQQMQAQIMAQFEQRVARELRLDRATMREVTEVLAAMQQERHEIFQRSRAHTARLRAIAAEGGSDSEAREILREARAIRAREARIANEEEMRLLEVLSATQLLRFQIVRDDFNERIRRMQRPSPGRPPSSH